MRSSTLATFDEVRTVPVTTSLACGVVELTETQRICGGASGASIKIVGVAAGDGTVEGDGDGEVTLCAVATPPSEQHAKSAAAILTSSMLQRLGRAGLLRNARLAARR